MKSANPPATKVPQTFWNTSRGLLPKIWSGRYGGRPRPGQGAHGGRCLPQDRRQPTSYHRWRQRLDPAKVDEARRIRELQVEVERLKLLVAELLLDKRMLQDIAKKATIRK